ncbi:MAG: TIGR01212 family radical SAM protein [Firmicutes bacterium]|nr:TIGR01212 family radical SAM protein [Bacillota bacterium]
MNFKIKEKPYYTVNDFYQETFHSKVFKISLNGNFTCPNRDGTISYKGCLYCSEKGSGEFTGDLNFSLKDQYQEMLSMMKRKWPIGKTIAYFQSFTNTYAPLDKLKRLFEEALTLDKDLIGISIATRPDCLPDDVIEYLSELNQKTFLTVELGLQTIHEKTSILINRGHSLQAFQDAVSKLRAHNIHVVCHIINGLPNETKEMMLDTIHFLNSLDIQGIKIHMLYLLKNTPLEDYYNLNPFPILSLKEYVDVVTNQIEQLRPDIIIYRLTGDALKSDLIEPKWSLKKFVVTNEIDKQLRINKTYQGINYK